MNDRPRLIEQAFPLKQTSTDSVHEKNVRHGHISTLHIWPARRPLAACRAALISTLLPDPGSAEERKALLERIGGKIVKVLKKKKLPSGKVEEQVVEETVGGILHWGRESDLDIDWFREEIRKAYGGRAPRVLDPFAGGGAIPLEAMRLGCEATAIDINPVAWFILKCTLEYPHKLKGQKRPLPDFVQKDKNFMEAFFKAQGLKGAMLRSQLQKLGIVSGGEQRLPGFDIELATLEADLAWHVRAWGWWVLEEVKKELSRFYPVIDGKPAVAYLWARTVKCKSCRSEVPLLKTRWLCKKDKKRVVLGMEPKEGKTGVKFGVQNDVPVVGGNAAQRREHDKKLGAGTMSKSGAKCPCCCTIMTMEDIRLEGQAGRLGAVMTAVVVDGTNGKEYRLPTQEEINAAEATAGEIDRVFTEIPFGVPEEPTPGVAGRRKSSSSLRTYGLNRWRDLFNSRQLVALGTFLKYSRSIQKRIIEEEYSAEWGEALAVYSALVLSRLTDRTSTICHWSLGRETIQNTFSRFALPISWDFSEVNTIATSSGTYDGQVEWVAEVIEHCMEAEKASPGQEVLKQSSKEIANTSHFDLILTDPPYYDAIIYSDIMDFFYVWLRRSLHGLSLDFDRFFIDPLSPKWNHEKNDGELIDDPGRFSWNYDQSQKAYEEGMHQVFLSCHRALVTEGRLVIVFAHKNPTAWETLVSAIIRAGFVVDGSWPIQTEMGNRTRALSSAALSSSVWLVCRKRPEAARPGWDNKVFEEMRVNIRTKLRNFWDAGIRGPDFVWAATGPALEAYSAHPVVKKANEPGKLMEVPEFLGHVRRIVVDFVVGRVLSHGEADDSVSGLDDVTTYYLLHRNDFGMKDAPSGACILYALSCGLSDRELSDKYDILQYSGGKSDEEVDSEEGEEEDTENGTGSTVRLKTWNSRMRKSMGFEGPGGKAPPLIDQVHRLMHLWKQGDVVKVDEYTDARGLRKHQLFNQLLQAIIELSHNEERSLLESISNHLASRGARGDQMDLPLENY